MNDDKNFLARPIGLKHVSVLLEEAMEFIATPGTRIVVDATLGGAGHAEEILRRAPSVELLVGIDRDETALERSKKRLAPYGARVAIAKADYADLDEVLDSMNIEKVDAVLMDLGVSSFQLDEAERGFSFSRPGPLDMRMDRETGTTAADIVNTRSEKELASIFFSYGEEKNAKRIARAIVERRKAAPITDTVSLAEIVTKASPVPKGGMKIHPATRVFQALRIAVNGELSRLRESIEKVVDRLNVGGRIVVISFHSLEDRIVKHTFLDLSERCVCPKGFPVCVCGRLGKLKVLTSKPVSPAFAETESNPRARSARLRAARRI